MRLKPEQQAVIRSAVAEVYGEAASVWLFGSRVNDEKRGGNIDLLVGPGVISPTPSFTKKIELLVKLEHALGGARFLSSWNRPIIPGR